MNLRSVVALADESLTTVDCMFNKGNTVYTFKCELSTTGFLTPGAQVLVDTTCGVRVASVVEVHKDSKIDPDDGIEYRWLFGIVPMGHLESLKRAEDDKIEAIAQNRRQALRTKMKTMLEGDGYLMLDGQKV